MVARYFSAPGLFFRDLIAFRRAFVIFFVLLFLGGNHQGGAQKGTGPSHNRNVGPQCEIGRGRRTVYR